MTHLLDMGAAWQQARAQFAPRPQRWANPGELAAALDPTTIQTPALDIIDGVLADVKAGKSPRVMVSMAPQEGKSERVSRRFPTWMLANDPSMRIAIVSYAQRIARRWGEVIRDDIVAHGHKMDIAVKPDAAADEWRIVGKRGGVYCTGIGGPLTGRAVDCLRGDTLILTDRGYVQIRDLHEAPERPRVLTVDHATGATQWKPIIATRAIPDRPLVEVLTTSGRRVVCTHDHRIYVSGRGYTAAVDLAPGDRLLAAARGGSDVRRMHDDVPAAPVRGGESSPEWRRADVLHETLLERHDGAGERRSAAVRDLRGTQAGRAPEGPLVLPSVHADCADGRRGVRALLDVVHAAAVRVHEAIRATGVLLAGLRGRLSTYPGQAMPTLREADRVEGPWAPVLRAGMPAGGQPGGQGTPVSAVWPGVPSEEHTDGVLRSDLRERGARPADGRRGQLALQDGHQLRPVVPADASADLRAGRAQVRGLQDAGSAVPGDPKRRHVDAYEPAGAPHQREAAGQPAAEPDHVVQDVPRRAPQVGHDTVAVVRVLRGQRDTVYDLQVEGNHNFFADQVLVHNCLIIDDPYKDGPQADSKAWNERVQSWWTEVAVPRLGPGVAVCIVQTRWREDDLTGWLQQREDGDIWRVVNIPAQADHNPDKGETDLLGREPGEFMISARGRSRDDWEARKKAMGTRAWTALCQGRPAPATGDIFDAGWWQQYEQPQWVVLPSGVHQAIGFDEVIISVDCAFKDTDASDYVAMQVWGRRGVQAYLLDQVHDRMSFVETLQQFQMLAAKWPQAVLKLVEDKANGTALINMLSRSIGGIVPVEPEGSKVERAFAITPFVEAKNVFLPDPKIHLWVYKLIEETKMFPRGAHDDQVDALTQALNRLLLNPLIVNDRIVEDDEDGPPEGSISLF